MQWHINDLSLNGQFADPLAFKAALEPLLQLRHRDPLLRSRLYCSRLLHTCQVTATANLRQTVVATRDKTFVGLVLGWMAKYGPFWDDDRQPNVDDYFEYETHDVTDQGLGEAARRILVDIVANAFSFQGSKLPFTTSPLLVQQGLAEAPIAIVNIDNHWEVEQLVVAAQSSRIYRSWPDVHYEIKSRFDGLIIPDNVIEALLATPFSEQVTKRIFELLRVLNHLVTESDENGKLSPAGNALLAEHFVGKKAWFTNESQGNKVNFKKELTFFDPDDAAKEIFCSWHGKIKTPQIRIHIQWPRPAGQKEIKVVFIGPKITKG
ncbi:MAG: hypothetical protein JRD93_14825 [Deltaproteobacteria bacterium]|nr:hypothetical protein [Deltaproteobacteria bacterium]